MVGLPMISRNLDLENDGQGGRIKRQNSRRLFLGLKRPNLIFLRWVIIFSLSHKILCSWQDVGWLSLLELYVISLFMVVSAT